MPSSTKYYDYQGKYYEVPLEFNDEDFKEYHSGLGASQEEQPSDEGLVGLIKGIVSGDVGASDIGEGAWKGLKQFFSELPDTLDLAMKGSNRFTDPTSEYYDKEYKKTQEEAGFELTSAVGAGSFSRSVVKGGVPGTTSIFGSTGAKNANISKLAEAKELLANARYSGRMGLLAENTHDKIWKKTGWYQGPSGDWVFEIPDIKPYEKAVKSKNIKQALGTDKFTVYQLENLIDHPSLYDNYPDLKGIGVVFNKQGQNTFSGSFDKEANLITINTDKIKTPEDLVSVLLHETQHAVQTKEGLPEGGNYNSKDELIRQLHLDEMQLVEAKLGNKIDPDLADRMIKVAKGNRERLKKMLPREVYKRLEGEIEARNVQERVRRYNEDDLKRLSPMATQELTPNESIVYQPRK